MPAYAAGRPSPSGTVATQAAGDHSVKANAVRCKVAMYIALLRGINVGGRNQIPMPKLRSVCEDLGWGEVQHYIQSGNLVFKAGAAPASLEAALEQAIARSFSLSIPVIVRAVEDWASYVKGNPFPEASRNEPNFVQLALSKAPPRQGAEKAIERRATLGERAIRVDDALWIHFPSGVGKSKLSPALLDRLVGSPVTMRNLRTVFTLEEMAQGR